MATKGFTAKQVERIIAHYGKGKAAAEIGEKFGVSASTILRVLRNAEVEIRPRGRQPKSVAA